MKQRKELGPDHQHPQGPLLGTFPKPQEPPGHVGKDAKHPVLKRQPPSERWTHSVRGALNARAQGTGKP